MAYMYKQTVGLDKAKTAIKHLLAGAVTQGPMVTSEIPGGAGITGDEGPTLAGCSGFPGPVPSEHTGMQDGRAGGGGGV